MSDEKELVIRLLDDILAYVRQENLSTTLAPTYPSLLKTPLISKEYRQKPPPLPPNQDNSIKQNRSLETPKNPPPTKKSPSIEEHSLRLLMEKILPDVPLARQIPSDQMAKTLAELYKKPAPQVGLLVFHPEQLPFLKGLAKAIHQHLSPAIIWKADQIKRSDSLRLFLATQADISSHKEYKQTPSPSLFEVPLLLLAPPEDYAKNPSLKRALWKQLCQILA